MSKPRLLPPWILVIIIGIIVLLFSFINHVSNNSDSPQPTPVPSPSLIPLTPTPSPQFSNWRLYQNPKYDYQFKYDPSWSLTDTLPHHLRYDAILLQKNTTPLIQIALVKFKSNPVTIEELLDQLKSQTHLPASSFKTLNFGRQHIYSLRLLQPQQIDYYFLHKGLVFKITFYHLSSSQLSPSQSHFLDTFTLL